MILININGQSFFYNAKRVELRKDKIKVDGKKVKDKELIAQLSMGGKMLIDSDIKN